MTVILLQGIVAYWAHIYFFWLKYMFGMLSKTNMHESLSLLSPNIGIGVLDNTAGTFNLELGSCRCIMQIHIYNSCVS